jgi:putative peptide maturation dehydrogenase
MPIHCGPIMAIEMDWRRTLNLANIVDGGPGFDEVPSWSCHAAHLDAPVQVELSHLEVLRYVRAQGAVGHEQLSRFSEEGNQYLLLTGLLLDDERPEHEAWRSRAQLVSGLAWDAFAAISVVRGRWLDVDLEVEHQSESFNSLSVLVARFGLPPTHDYRYVRADSPLPLAEPKESGLSGLLRTRSSCRAFASSTRLEFGDFSTIMFRPFAVLRTSEVVPGLIVAHKGVPSGGSLHPIEAYVLARNIEEVDAGLYHYQATRHELVTIKRLHVEEAGILATSFLAGQCWARDAAAVIVMTGRIDRQSWKYRHHPKALRVLYMDAGHLSQTAYLTATELGLGVNVSAAINERNIEIALGLVPMVEIPVAALVIGPASEARQRDSGEMLS